MTRKIIELIYFTYTSYILYVCVKIFFYFLREVEDFARRLNSDWPERVQELLSIGQERRPTLYSINGNGCSTRCSSMYTFLIFQPFIYLLFVFPFFDNLLLLEVAVLTHLLVDGYRVVILSSKGVHDASNLQNEHYSTFDLI